MPTVQLFAALVTLALGSAAVLARGASNHLERASTHEVDELWMEPADLERRDLYRGPAVGPAPPRERQTFTFLENDTTGRSPGYEVRDGNGVTWSIKYGREAQSEVAASRILWAIGFHQPPSYFVREWTLSGAPPLEPGRADDLELGGRFRPDVDGWEVTVDRWEWNANPHMTWQPHAGLLVAQMIINNWDLKDSNNKIYEVSDGSPGPRRRYVVRDLGASLGSNEQAKWLRWTQLRISQGSKNDLAGFLDSGFIEGVEGGRVKFEYSGPNKPYVANITPEDVRWTARLLARLSDRQWHDAFRAGGYDEADAGRYIAKIKDRIQVGLALK